MLLSQGDSGCQEEPPGPESVDHPERLPSKPGFLSTFLPLGCGQLQGSPALQQRKPHELLAQSSLAEHLAPSPSFPPPLPPVPALPPLPMLPPTPLDASVPPLPSGPSVPASLPPAPPDPVSWPP